MIYSSVTSATTAGPELILGRWKAKEKAAVICDIFEENRGESRQKKNGLSVEDIATGHGQDRKISAPSWPTMDLNGCQGEGWQVPILQLSCGRERPLDLMTYRSV